MSFDLNLPTTCNHFIYRELTTLASDRRNIRVSKPIASVGNLEVFASDNSVPKSDYGVVLDPTTIAFYQPTMIRLNTKWPATQDYWEVNYNTIKGHCPKCVGLGVIDDISYDVRGQLALTRNEPLLLQNLEKWVITELGSNVFHNFVGTSLVRLIGERISNRSYLTTRISQEINNALIKFKDLQSQYIATGRPMTSGEILASIDNIKVAEDTGDPTIMRADVTVRAQSGKSVTYTQYLKIPEG